MLSRIRNALKNPGATQLPQPGAISSNPDRTELVRQLVENARRVDVTAHIANTIEEGHAVLQRWLTDLRISGFLYVPSPVLDRLGITQIGSSVPIPLSTMADDEARSLLLNSPAGASEAAAALSNTGTIIEASGPGRSRLISLLPPVHISVVTSDRIFFDLATWLDRAKLSEAFAISSAFTLITGPSRTADIEQTLTKGVHGPGQVYMLVLDE
jgi:L-lactate dehydrogenase complex protein LldG